MKADERWFSCFNSEIKIILIVRVVIKLKINEQEMVLQLYASEVANVWFIS